MTSALLPVAICLMSAILLAATNVLVKRGGDILTSRMVLSIVMALSVLPLAFFVPLPPRETLPLLALSMAVHWFYQFSAIRAMHRGDLSLVFPVMRGLGPLATAMIASIALKEALTLWQMAGLVTASAAIIACAAAGLRSFAPLMKKAKTSPFSACSLACCVHRPIASAA